MAFGEVFIIHGKSPENGDEEDEDHNELAPGEVRTSDAITMGRKKVILTARQKMIFRWEIREVFRHVSL